jgi:hypothetical protein
MNRKEVDAGGTVRDENTEVKEVNETEKCLCYIWSNPVKHTKGRL